MGSSASKTARTAGKAATRKYPTRTPPASTGSAKATTNATSGPAAPSRSPGPTVHPETRASNSRDDAINRDSSDPDLALNARLSKLGPVQPNPTLSNSSTFNTSASSFTSQNQTSSRTPNQQSSPQSFTPSASSPSQSIFPSAAANPAVKLLGARQKLAEEADAEFSEIGRRGARERRFLDVVTVRQVLMLRDGRGLRDEEIERQLGLGKGIVGKLGKSGVVSVAEH